MSHKVLIVKDSFFYIVLIYMTLSSALLQAAENLSSLVESVLTRDGDNVAQLRMALDKVPAHQVEGMQFLIA